MLEPVTIFASSMAKVSGTFTEVSPKRFTWKFAYLTWLDCCEFWGVERADQLVQLGKLKKISKESDLVDVYQWPHKVRAGENWAVTRGIGDLMFFR